jgi:hypothetical protein
MRWLKSLVTLLGFLIVGSLVLLGYGFFKKSQNPDWQLSHIFIDPPAPQPKTSAPATTMPKPTATPPKSPLPAPKAFGDVSLNLPAGCAVNDLVADGQRVYLTIGPPGPCHRVIILDTEAGKVLGTVRVSP